MYNDAQAQQLKQLNDQDFLMYGVGDVAYIKPVTQANGQRAYGIYTADGNAVAALEKYEIARAMAMQHDLTVMTIQ